MTPEVLKAVKGIELRTRSLVNSLFTGGYRSVFRGQGIEFAEVRAYQHGDLQRYVLYIVVVIAALLLFNLRFDRVVEELWRR